jgi:hypothetical protein
VTLATTRSSTEVLASKSIEQIAGSGKYLRARGARRKKVFWCLGMKGQKQKRGDYCSVYERGSALRLTRARRPTLLKQVNRRAVGRPGKNARRRKQLMEILAHALQPGILSGCKTPGTRKGIAHEWASVPAPDLANSWTRQARTRDEKRAQKNRLPAGSGQPEFLLRRKISRGGMSLRSARGS